MSSPQRKNLIFHNLIGALGLILLAACAPTELEGAHTDGMARIGAQLQARGDDAGAADFYARSLQHAPNDVVARKGFGELLEAHGEIERAADQYQAGLRVEPNNGDLLHDYGRVLLKLNRPAEAKQQYQKVLQADAGNIKALNGLGVSLDYLNEHAAAQAVYREALDHDAGDITTLANLGHSYVLSGAWDEAIKLLEPHLNDKDTTRAFRQNLAEAYGMAGMDADAERVMRMDLPSEQVKRNLAYYRSHRAKLGSGIMAADLGSYSTADIAEAHADDIRNQFPDDTAGLTLSVLPEVKSIGSTPVFTIRATGFEKTSKLRGFCAKLKKEDIVCTARTPS